MKACVYGFRKTGAMINPEISYPGFIVSINPQFRVYTPVPEAERWEGAEGLTAVSWRSEKGGDGVNR